MSQNDLITGLPAELSCELLREWLVLKDCVHLDSAYCEESKRRSLFKDVYESSHSVITHMPALQEEEREAIIDWIADRNISVKTLYICDRDDMAVYANYLRSFGHHMQNLHVYGIEEELATPVLSSVAQECSNIKFLACTDLTVSEALMEVLQDCLHLEELEWHNVDASSYDNDLQSIIDIPSTHHLKLKSIDLDCDELAAACVFKMCDPESVRRMRVPADKHMPEWSQFVNLQSLGFAGDTAEVDDDILLHILAQCPWVVNLDLSHAENLSHEGVIEALGALHELRALNMEHLADFSDEWLDEIVQVHGHTLEALFVYDTDISDDAVNRALEECPQLHTISFSDKGEIDFALMSNITTMVTDCFGTEEMWPTVRENCPNLQHVHMLFPDNVFNRDDFLVVHEAVYEIPTLQVIHILDEFARDFDDVLSKRRSLRIVQEKDSRWNNHF